MARQDGGPPAAAPAAGRGLREYGRALGIAVVLAIVVRGCMVEGFRIPSSSMLPTLQVGDHVLVDKLRYGLHNPLGGWLLRYADPAPGDIVVFAAARETGRDYIKRVVATAGEVVEIHDKHVRVDGRPRPLPGTYFVEGTRHVHSSGPRDNFGPVTVPAGHVFVLGDNRDQSVDSRYWGCVDVADVRGKALVIYWSLDTDDNWVRWERLGELVH